MQEMIYLPLNSLAGHTIRPSGFGYTAYTLTLLGFARVVLGDNYVEKREGGFINYAQPLLGQQVVNGMVKSRLENQGLRGS